MIFKRCSGLNSEYLFRCETAVMCRSWITTDLGSWMIIFPIKCSLSQCPSLPAAVLSETRLVSLSYLKMNNNKVKKSRDTSPPATPITIQVQVRAGCVL